MVNKGEIGGSNLFMDEMYVLKGVENYDNV
jgi:hypothetical protein